MRGTGLGYALYSEIIKQGKRPSTTCRMECARLETPAIEFYEKSGAKYFVIVRVQMDE
jgi:GNAT superfamily N-acetyltransferase